MRFSCLSAFWFNTFITETSKYEHRINTFIFLPYVLTPEYARRAVRPDVSGPSPRPCKYRILEENELIEVKNLVKRLRRPSGSGSSELYHRRRSDLRLLGPNGAGKSTTMNIMTGYIGATEGDVLINGHNILGRT